MAVAIQHGTSHTSSREISGSRLPTAEDLSAATFTASEIQDRYREPARNDYFHGGWSENPDFSPTVYSEFQKFVLTAEGAAITPGQVCIVGANKIWALLEKLNGQAQVEVEVAAGVSHLGGSRPHQNFVSGGTIVCGTLGKSEQDRVSVYVCSNRESLDNNYLDKNVEVSWRGHRYEMRAVSHRDTDLPSITLDGKPVSKELLGDVCVVVAQALKQAHNLVLTGDVFYRPDFFDRRLSGFTPAEIAKLVRIAHDSFPGAS